MSRPPADLGNRRPGPDRITDRGYWAASQLAYWRRRIADSQLEAVETNLVWLDRFVALGIRDFPPALRLTPGRVDRLRAAMLERGFEWQKRLQAAS